MIVYYLSMMDKNGLLFVVARIMSPSINKVYVDSHLPNGIGKDFLSVFISSVGMSCDATPDLSLLSMIVLLLSMKLLSYLDVNNKIASFFSLTGIDGIA